MDSFEQPNFPDNVKRAVTIIVAIIMAMEFINASALNTSLPQIARSLHSNPIDLKVAITTYLLSLGIFIPVSAWLVDCIGERRTLTLAISVFLASAIGCALSQNLIMLVIFRLLQGASGAFLAPIARLTLLRTYGRKDIVYAMTQVTKISMLALMIGPLLGGAITTYINWRWIFLINVPPGLLAIFFIQRYLPLLTALQRRKFDLPGFIFLGLALGALLFLLDVIVQPNFTLLEKISLLIFTIVMVVAYYFHSKRITVHLLDFKVFYDRLFRLAALGSLFTRFTLSTLPFLVPLMLQATYGYTPLHAGLYAIPMALGALGSRPLIKVALKNFSYRQLLLGNSLILFICFISYTVNGFSFIPALLIIQQFILGFASAIQYTSMNSLAYKNLNPEQISRGVSIYSAIIQLSASFGVAVAALIMVRVIGNDNLTHYIPAIAFKVVFIVQSLFLLIATWLFYRLPGDTSNKFSC